MKRSGPPTRRTALAPGDSRLKRSRLAPVSARRRAEAPVRSKALAAVGRRDGTGCTFRPLGGCVGRVAGHEIVRRSQLAGSHLMPEVIVLVCEAHHRLDLHKLTAERWGLRIPRWAYDADPLAAVLEAGRIRALRLQRYSGPDTEPFWRR